MDLLTTTIDLDAIAHNTRVLKKLAGTAQLMCVVKADGYNHGAVETAQVMARNGADQFGVATLAEAQQLLGELTFVAFEIESLGIHRKEY